MDQFEVLQATATTDRLCESISTCTLGEFILENATNTSDRSCGNILNFCYFKYKYFVKENAMAPRIFRLISINPHANCFPLAQPVHM